MRNYFIEWLWIFRWCVLLLWVVPVRKCVFLEVNSCVCGSNARHHRAFLFAGEKKRFFSRDCMQRKITLNVSFILGDCKGTKAANKFSIQDFVIRYQHSNKGKQSASSTISLVCECVVSVLCNLQCPHNNLKVNAGQHKCRTRQMRIFGQSDTTRYFCTCAFKFGMVNSANESFFPAKFSVGSRFSHSPIVFFDDSSCLEH